MSVNSRDSAGGERVAATDQKAGNARLFLHDQNELDAEQQLFNDLFENAPVGYIVLNSEGKICQINPSGAALLGEEQTDMMGQFFGGFVADSDHGIFIDFLQRTFHSDARESCELGINNRRERLLFVHMEGMAAANKEECRVILRDVTESRIVKESMSFNEAKYRALFENLSVAFSYQQILKDSDGQVCDSIILEANSLYCAMLGKALPEFIGKKTSEVGLFSLSSDFDWKTLYHRGLATGHPVTFEYYVDAFKRWFLIIAFVPSPQHIAFIYLDTTETKEKEQLMIESEKRYRSLVREANAIIMILNNDGEISFMNEFGLAFFGYRSEDIIGKCIFGTIVCPENLKDRDPKQLFKKFKAKIQRHHRGLIESVTVSGQRVLVDWTVQECRNFIGEEASYVAVGLDAIDAKRSQRELGKLNERNRRKTLFNDGINRRISQSELVGAAKQLGIMLVPPFSFVLMDLGKQNMSDHQGKIENFIELLHPWDTGAAWLTSEGVAVVKSLLDPSSKDVLKGVRATADEILNKASQYGFSNKDIHVGCSHSTHPMQSIAELYDQAYAALSYGPVIHAERLLHHWDDLGFYQFIVKDLRTGMAHQFVQDQLGPLIQMSRTGARDELMETLREIVSGTSAQLISERLHIHRQTLVFRKKGLEKILGVDLDSAEVILNIAIAIKMMSMSEQEKAPTASRYS